jgi:hypothetical protein
MPNLQLRGGTLAAWAAANPLLLDREMGVETDTGRFKIGNGVLNWNSLPYASGPPGATNMSSFLPEAGEPFEPVWGEPSGQPSRNQLAPDAKNWTFLGTATGTGITVGPVVWTGEYRQFMAHYVIAGANTGTGVGRFLVGAASLSTTGLTNGSSLCEGVTAPTLAPSIPGLPLAVTLSNIAREGWIWIDGLSGGFKRLNVLGQNGNAAIATPPTLFRAAGVFSDLGTNLLLQRAQLTLYDTLVAVTVSANTFLAGTALTVWGRNND